LRGFTAIVLSALLGSCSSPPSLLEQIIRQGELRVVTQNSPTTFYYGADEARGIEFELARGFAQRIGVSLKMYTTDEFWKLLPELHSGKAHIGAAGLTATAPREKIVAFGPAYQSVEPQLIYRMGTKRPKSFAELNGGSLEVPRGSSHVDLLERARRQTPYLQWTEKADTRAEALIGRVARGEIDFAVVNSNDFSLLRHYYPEAKVAFGLGAANPVAWALPKHAPELRESIAAYFAEIESTGELKEILDRYYYASRDFDFVGSRAFVRHLNARLPDYQNLFVQAALETGVDWRLLAAISYQESHWNAAAVSPTGVRGLMMLTEKTARMLNVEDRSNPRDSILGGARYFRRVLQKIPERIPEEDRIWMAVAAYNVGFGHLEDARVITQMQGGDADDWEEVRARLPLLSDESWHKRVERGFARGSVPVTYVDNIRRYYALLQWMSGTEILSKQPQPKDDRDHAPG
jgi:membrane-bound lytic murein transglycosylase F